MRTQPAKKNNIKLFRKYHRIFAIWFLTFLMTISVTGILLGWKKHSGSLFLPKTIQGSNTDLSFWLSFDSLNTIAVKTMQNLFSSIHDPGISRIDARPDKGMVKFVFENHNIEIQLDASTGDVLFVGKRWSDVIERLHDGSIVDRWFGLKGDYFKLIYSTLLGLGMILLAVTGFLVWNRSGGKIFKS